MKILGVDEKGRPILGDLLPPDDRPQHEPEPHGSDPGHWTWGKVLFSAVVALAAGIAIASGGNSATLTERAAKPAAPLSECDRYLKPSELRDDCNRYLR